ncbi:hypothetical protein QT971_06250 [Microcoleus sp. herbarium19]|uniref:hypothetical protein n=1 Tax=Microcoleus sp. herbarium19 TaxID=3055440 RepID=UPI002FD577BF
MKTSPLTITGCVQENEKYYFYVGSVWETAEGYWGGEKGSSFQFHLNNFLSTCRTVVKEYAKRVANQERFNDRYFDPFIYGIRIVDGKLEFRIPGSWVVEPEGVIFPIQIYLFLNNLSKSFTDEK